VPNEHVELRATRDEIRREFDRMRRSPVALARPAVVLAGWRSPPLMAISLAARLAGLTSGNRRDILSVTYATTGSIERAADIAHRRILDTFGPTSQHSLDRPTPDTIASRGAPNALEMDIIAISMGGLVARVLATRSRPNTIAPPLRIRRLFTLATPHRGARLARWIRPDSAAGAMRPGSDFLRGLDAQLPALDAELVCYAQRRDWWVGTWNTAPAGRSLIVANVTGPISMALSHFTVHHNPMVILDLSRRLRGEPPVETIPCPEPGRIRGPADR
jgi:hypothetical protein